MIGMPRITFTMHLATHTNGPMPDTRISAHTSPNTVESSSEPSVTITVSRSPSKRMGMKLAASVQNIGAHARGFINVMRLLLAPLRQNFVHGAVLLKLFQRRVDSRQERRVALADADSHRA